MAAPRTSRCHSHLEGRKTRQLCCLAHTACLRAQSCPHPSLEGAWWRNHKRCLQSCCSMRQHFCQQQQAMHKLTWAHAHAEKRPHTLVHTYCPPSTHSFLPGISHRQCMKHKPFSYMSASLPEVAEGSGASQGSGSKLALVCFKLQPFYMNQPTSNGELDHTSHQNQCGPPDSRQQRIENLHNSVGGCTLPPRIQACTHTCTHPPDQHLPNFCHTLSEQGDNRKKPI